MDLAHELKWKANSEMDIHYKVKHLACKLFKLESVSDVIANQCRDIANCIIHHRSELCEMDIYDKLKELKDNLEKEIKQQEQKLPFDICCVQCHYADLTIVNDDYKEIGSNLIRIVQLECPKCHYKLQIGNFR